MDNEYTIIKNKAQAFIKGLNSDSTESFGSSDWQLVASHGEYGSTHVIFDAGSKMLYKYRDKYFVTTTRCLKEYIDGFTQEAAVEDCSKTWQNC